MRDQPVGCALGFHLLGSLTKGKRLRLRANVREQHVVVPADWIERFPEGDEVAWDKSRPLMDQLVKGVLTVGSWLAPKDRARLIVNRSSIESNVFSVALHRQLLEIGWKTLEVLLVGK